MSKNILGRVMKTLRQRPKLTAAEITRELRRNNKLSIPEETVAMALSQLEVKKLVVANGEEWEVVG